jgi:hypothetical protein
VKFIMKTLLSFLLLAAIPASAQYTIDWSTLDGGGGQSSGGAYTLTGTIGQPDAATSSGGSYTLHGGFWSAFAVVPTEDAPSLRIIRSGPNVVLAWPNPSTSYQLQETLSLSSPNWTDVNAAPGVVGNERQVNQTLNPGPRFYRLRKP